MRRPAHGPKIFQFDNRRPRLILLILEGALEIHIRLAMGNQRRSQLAQVDAQRRRKNVHAAIKIQSFETVNFVGSGEFEIEVAVVQSH